MRRWLLLSLMFASGLAGISYEILYGRVVGNLIGDQFAVSAAVLITFLFGIAIGARFAWRMQSWLWLIETAIGLVAVLAVICYSGIERLLYGHVIGGDGGFAASLFFAILLLLLPALFVGTTLPLFAAMLSRIYNEERFSQLYLIYNFGAAITALMIEFVLIRTFGIMQTLLLFSLLNLMIGVLLRLFFAGKREVEEVIVRLPQLGGKLWALIIMGIASAIFQLLMLKFAEMYMGPFRSSFALVLAIVLLGLAVGSYLVRRFTIGFDRWLLIGWLSLICAVVAFEPLLELYAAIYPSAEADGQWLLLLKFSSLLLLMGGAATAFGATVPALLMGMPGNLSRASGQLLFIVSLANVAGFILMVFLLHPYIEYGAIFTVIIALVLIAWLLHEKLTMYRIAAALMLLLVSGVLVAKRWDESLLYVSYSAFHSTGQLDQARTELGSYQSFRGHQDLFSINELDGAPYFFINGYISMPLNTPSEMVVGAVSSMHAPKLDRALVLGLGSGATASVVGQLFQTTDVVEINPVVRENLYRMRQWNLGIDDNASIHVDIDDANHYLRRSRGRYDLILNTVTTPLYFSSSKLYTREFLQLAKQHLDKSGLYVTWMDGRVGDRGADIILNTLTESFDYCAIHYVKASYFLLLCSDAPISPHQLQQVGHHPLLKAQFASRFGLMSEWLGYQLLNQRAFDLIDDQQTAINRIDYPALEFEMERLKGRGIVDFKVRLLDMMGGHHFADGDAGFSDAELLLHTAASIEDAAITMRWLSLVDFNAQQSQAALRAYIRRMSEVNNADAMHRLGYVLMQLQYYEAAEALFAATLNIDAHYDNANFNLGACYEYRGMLQEALTAYHREGELDADDGDAVYRQGRVLYKMGQFGAAVAKFHQAESFVEMVGDQKLYRYLALAYDAMGDDQRAVAYRRRVGQ